MFHYCSRSKISKCIPHYTVKLNISRGAKWKTHDTYSIQFILSMLQEQHDEPCHVMPICMLSDLPINYKAPKWSGDLWFCGTLLPLCIDCEYTSLANLLFTSICLFSIQERPLIFSLQYCQETAHVPTHVGEVIIVRLLQSVQGIYMQCCFIAENIRVSKSHGWPM